MELWKTNAANGKLAQGCLPLQIFWLNFMPSIEIGFYKYTKVQHSSNLPVNCMYPVAIQLVLTDVPLAPPCCSHLTFAEDA